VGGLYFRNHPTLDAALRSFHTSYYNAKDATWANSTWLGVPAEKTPQDAWIYQEILHETRPDVLIEAGTADGGSAYYFATMFDLLGHGRVITIDIADSPKRPKPQRHPKTVARVRPLKREIWVDVLPRRLAAAGSLKHQLRWSNLSGFNSACPSLSNEVYTVQAKGPKPGPPR
jgi:hypothetical protein